MERYPHLRPAALVEALHIVMHNNRMKLGNLLVHQHKGIVMGMATAPSIANLFVVSMKKPPSNIPHHISALPPPLH
jgi:hypothetical protein